MLLYYITDRRQFAGDERQKRALLLGKIAEATRAGLDFIQLREKDLSGRELETLAREAMAAVHDAQPPQRQLPLTRLLINSRADVALATGADGVHLPAKAISAADVRAIFDISARNVQREAQHVCIGVSCHTASEVRLAESQGADFAVFGPVFAKSGAAVAGLETLRQVCARSQASDGRTEAAAFGKMPVLALGGVTLENARACMAAGAAGIAAIRLFQENAITEVAAQLRSF